MRRGPWQPDVSLVDQVEWLVLLGLNWLQGLYDGVLHIGAGLHTGVLLGGILEHGPHGGVNGPVGGHNLIFELYHN